MRILALETATRLGSLATWDGFQRVHQVSLDAAQRTTQTLFPALQSLLEQSGWKAQDVEWVGVDQGPGSFTGLRIGVTVAKTFAYATGAAVRGISSLHVLAQQAAEAQPDRPARLVPVLDAHRQQVFTACFDWDPGRRQLQRLLPDRILPVAQWLEELPPGARACGPILSQLAQRLPPQVEAVPEAAWTPHALTVARITAEGAACESPDSCWSLKPHYLRASAAEEKRQAPDSR